MSDEKYFYRVSIKGLVFDKENRLMFLKEENGLWDLPGGSMEHGETFQQTLVREIKEEMGVECEIIDKEPVAIWSGESKPGTFRIWIAFRIKLLTNNFVKSNEYADYQFLDTSEFSKIQLRFGTKELISFIEKMKQAKS